MFKPIFCVAISLLWGASVASAQEASSQQGTLFYQFFNRSNGLVDKVPKGDINSQITRSAVEDGPQLVGLDCYGVTYDPNSGQMCFVRSHFITQGDFKGDYSAFYLCNLDGTDARLLQREREDYSGFTEPVADFTPYYASNGDLLFETNNRIARMNGHGSNVRFLTGATEKCGLPSESQGVISFEKDGVCICDVQGNNRRRVAGFPTYYGTQGNDNSSYCDAKVSPDGKQIVFARNKQIFVCSLEPGSKSSLISGDALKMEFSDPVWSPDGRFVAVAGTLPDREQHDIYLIALETGKLRRITNSPDDELPCDWRVVLSPGQRQFLNVSPDPNIRR